MQRLRCIGGHPPHWRRGDERTVTDERVAELLPTGRFELVAAPLVRSPSLVPVKKGAHVWRMKEAQLWR